MLSDVNFMLMDLDFGDSGASRETFNGLASHCSQCVHRNSYFLWASGENNLTLLFDSLT